MILNILINTGVVMTVNWWNEL